MNNKSKKLIAFLSILSNSGCAVTADRSLSPPSDTQWVNVEIKKPSHYTNPFHLRSGIFLINA